MLGGWYVGEALVDKCLLGGQVTGGVVEGEVVSGSGGEAVEERLWPPPPGVVFGWPE